MPTHTDSRAAYLRLERRELYILEAKSHALRTIGNECTDLLSKFLTTEHDDAKALDLFKEHVSLFKDAWCDYCDQKAKVDEMVQLQQVKEQ